VDEARMDAIDLLVNVLREHEKKLDDIAGRFEKLLNALVLTKKTSERSGKVEEVSNFTKQVKEFLTRLPKGFDFEIPKVTHTAYVKIIYVEPNVCSETRERCGGPSRTKGDDQSLI